MSRKKKQVQILAAEAEVLTSVTKSTEPVADEVLTENAAKEMTEVLSAESAEAPEALTDTKGLETSEEAEADKETSESNELEASKKAIGELKAEIAHLQEQIKKLEELKKAQNRILAEIGDFVTLFPEIPIEEIPDTVWESVKQGAPLAASYALYEKRMVAEAKRIAEINAKNAKRSPGAAGKDTAGEYFSPEDVRRMSRAEVHANYSKIKDSMKKWM